jgi:copper chaperone
MPKVTEFKVGMTCDGCSSACTRILTKIDGVTDVQCDVAKQQILVTGDADEDAMLEALLKWSKASGKSVEKA